MKGPEPRCTGLVDAVGAIVCEADGYPVERWLAERSFWEEHVHPDDRASALAARASAAEKQVVPEVLYRMIAADRRVVRLRDLVRVVADSGGRPAWLCGVMADIAERMKVETRLAQEKRLLELIATSAPLVETLTALIRGIEALSENMLGSVVPSKTPIAPEKSPRR